MPIKLAIYEGKMSSDIVAGVRNAVTDSVDVINISLGREDVQDAIAADWFTAMVNNFFVFVAAGNEVPELGAIENGFPRGIDCTVTSTVDRWFQEC
ncbi:hypothetical protein ACLB2K_001668 [Fragaria x ananassa]